MITNSSKNSITQDVQKAEFELKKKKILLVDDQQTDLLNTKARIERALSYISCDTALCAEEAINMVKENHYDLILLEIQTPGLDGVEVSKRIRNLDHGTPIIAFTGLEKNEFDLSSFNYYLSKNDKNQGFYRNISKWLTDLEDDFAYLGNKEDYLKSLSGKKVLLADDQQINLMINKRPLERYGLIIIEASDGKELVEFYQNSLNAVGKSSFDLILTDINMPPFNGDEAAKQIRNIEAKNRISNQDEIPIIALLGDSQKEDIYHLFRCRMTDYFIKGTSQENLAKIIANYLIKKVDQGVAIKTEAKNTSVTPKDPLILNLSYISFFDKKEKRELISIFLEAVDKNIAKIKHANQKKNVKEISFCLHLLKGTSGNIGAEKMNHYLKIIEPEISKSGKLPDNLEYLDKLEKLYLELRAECVKLLGIEFDDLTAGI